MQPNPQPENTPQATTPQPQPTAEQTGATPQPTSTQQDMGNGAGIRGGYGDSDQTNGLEGGPEPQPHNDLTRRGVGD